MGKELRRTGGGCSGATEGWSDWRRGRVSWRARRSVCGPLEAAGGGLAADAKRRAAFRWRQSLESRQSGSEKRAFGAGGE